MIKVLAPTQLPIGRHLVSKSSSELFLLCVWFEQERVWQYMAAWADLAFATAEAQKLLDGVSLVKIVRIDLEGHENPRVVWAGKREE